MSTIKISLLGDSNVATSENSKNVIIVVDNIDQLSNLTVDSGIGRSLQLSDEAEIKLIHSASSTLVASNDSATSVEFMFLNNDSSTRRFVIVLLPTACSRHNSPSKSHALTQSIKGCKGSGNVFVLLLALSSQLAFAQACAISRQFPLYSMKSGSSKDSSVKIVIHLPSAEVAGVGFIGDVQNTVDNIRLAQRLVDAPPNVLHTDAYVAECREVAARLGCKINVIQGKDLEAQGFGGLWGVGKASEHLPALVVLSHVPEGAEGAQSVCMVGKGIVYDTGGLSIKTPTTNMAGMKVDMGGSAAVLGAFAAAVQSPNKLTTPLHALLCISENSVGPLATRPDDVHVFLSGKTVEVNNTDAEGRLVLSDGCFFAHRDLNPKVIIDIATLTGAQLIATGKNHAAIYCNDDELETVAVKAGKATGDLVFPIPYCPEFYRNEFKSQVRRFASIWCASV
jgi:probable aminopeptidase NPEPL1